MIKKKHLKTTIILIFCFVGLAVFSVPYFSDVFICKKIFEKLILEKTGWKCSYKHSSLSWFGKQTLSSLKMEDPKTGNQFFCEHLEFNTFFLPLSSSIRSLKMVNWTYTKNYEIVSENNDPNVSLDRKFPTSMSFFSENGNLVFINGIDVLSVRNINISKIKTFCLIEADTIENATPGNLSIEIHPENISNPLSLKMKSVPLSLFLLPFTQNYINCHDFVTMGSETSKDGKDWTCLIRSENLYSVIKGQISNSHLIIEKDHVSFLSLKSKIVSRIINESPQSYLSITSSNADVKIDSASIPLSLSKISRWRGEGYALIKDVTVISGNQEIVLERNKCFFKKNPDTTSGEFSSEVLLNKERSFLKGSFSYDRESNTSNIGIHQTNISEKFIEQILLLNNTAITIPPSGENYSMFFLGTFKNSEFSGHIKLSDSMLNIDLETNGSFSKQYFKLKGHYDFSERIVKNYGLPFNGFEITANGISVIQDRRLHITRLTGTAQNDNGEINFHAIESPYSNDYSLSIHGKLFDLPLFHSEENSSGLTIKDAGFAFNVDEYKKTASGNIKLIVKDSLLDPYESRIDVPHIVFNKFNPKQLKSWKDLSLNASGKAFHLSLHRILNFLKIPPGMFSDPTADMIFDINVHPKDGTETILSGEIISKNLEIIGKINMNDDLLSQDNSSVILKWKISPDAYNAFFEDKTYFPAFMLNRTALAEIVIDRMSCLSDTKGFDCLKLLPEGSMRISLKVSPLLFYDKESKESIMIDEIEGLLESNSVDSPLIYSVNGKSFSPNTEKTATGFLSFSGEIREPFSKTPFYKSSFTAENVYCPFIIGVFPFSPTLRNKLTTLSGKNADVVLETDFKGNKGKVDVNISSSDSELNVNLPLIITPSEITLRERMTANFQISNAVIEEILKDLNPLISLGATSDHPLTLVIYPKDFSVSLPYSIEKLRIGKGILNIGKIKITESKDILSLLTLIGEQKINHPIDAWFTPIHFDLSKGILTCKRFDALLHQNIHLALWGQTDLSNGHIAMTLGIDPIVLEKYFKGLPYSKDKLFLIKIKGHISEPEIDWKSANSRLSVLTQTKLGQYFIGDFLDKIFSTFGEKTPPPTTTPFPWKEHNQK